MLNYKIKVMSYDDAFRYVYNHAGCENDKKFAIISIQEHETERMGFQYIPGGNLTDVLNIHFSDIDNYLNRIEDEKLMTNEDAKQIKNFVETLNKKNEIELLIIHCYAGVSRSAAVAAAISKIFNGLDDEYFYGNQYIPNQFVYQKVMDAFGYKNNGNSFI